MLRLLRWYIVFFCKSLLSLFPLTLIIWNLVQMYLYLCVACMFIYAKMTCMKRILWNFVLWTFANAIEHLKHNTKIRRDKNKNNVGYGAVRINNKAACPKKFNYTSNFAHYFTWPNRKKSSSSFTYLHIIVVADVFIFQFYFRLKWTHRTIITAREHCVASQHTQYTKWLWWKMSKKCAGEGQWILKFIDCRYIEYLQLVNVIYLYINLFCSLQIPIWAWLEWLFIGIFTEKILNF